VGKRRNRRSRLAGEHLQPAARQSRKNRAPAENLKNYPWERGETDGQGLRVNTCNPPPDSRVSTTSS
ncbi:MAG: hypothetical protein IJU84_08150, partial [Clostridia bacterium]|nr:hypothetical protein [Clostridia bacterium]